MTVPVERRKQPRREDDVSKDDTGEIKDMLAGLVGMLTVHMTNEELEIAEIKHKIEEFFYDLDAHTHIFHHNKVAEVIKDDETSSLFWSKVKSSAAEKAIIFIMGCVATYLIALIWLDFGERVNKMEAKQSPTQVIIEQPVTVRKAPTPDVPNHP